MVYFLELERSADRDEGFIEVKEAAANEQHKSIFGALRAAASRWEFEQINFVVGNHGSVIESDFYTKLKKARNSNSSPIFRHRYAKRVIVSLLQSSDCVLASAGARSYEANHRGIEAEHRAQCACVRRCREEHTFTERQSWGLLNQCRLRMVNWESQSKTLQESGRRLLLYFTYSYCSLSRV